MTIEEIERTIEIIVGNQARLTQEQIKLGARQAQLDEFVKEVAVSHQALIERLRVQEERNDDHDRWRDAIDEKLAAQVKYEVRQERIEEAFSQVAESQHVIVQLASAHGERLDGTESRLSALIDAQVQLSHCMETLARNIAALNDRIGAHLNQAGEQIKALATAQTLTDEQIKILLEGSKKTGRASTKVAKKGGRSDNSRDSKSIAKSPSGESGAERGAAAAHSDADATGLSSTAVEQGSYRRADRQT
jgi:hypothetical protein